MSTPRRKPELEFVGPAHSLDFWRGNAATEHVEGGWDSEVPTRMWVMVWLRPGAWPRPEDVASARGERPDRYSDLAVGGEGDLPWDWLGFWFTCSGVEYVTYTTDEGDPEEAPDGWWAVDLWIREPERTFALQPATDFSRPN
jgi:hypothetical protein